MKVGRYKKTALAVAVGALMVASTASAELLLRGAFQDAGLSVDGFGATSGSGFLQSDVPEGSEVLAAFLYSADVWGSGNQNVTLAGNLFTTASGTLLTPDRNPANTMVWDVTSVMKPLIEGTWGLQSHSILEGGSLDGEVLAVVYRNASTVGQTAIIMDGELASGGDTTTLNFANPYTGGDLLMALAISFGFQPTGQTTEVDITTDSTIDRRLTSCAGGQDDGENANGALITVGGIGDDPANPDPFCSGSSGPRVDDELYNLALGNSADASPFINPGDTFLRLDTRNPSFDDNVFAMFLSSTFRISDVDDTPIDDRPPPSGVPEPATLALLGMGLMGLGALRRRRSEKSS